ncbi:MAG TPA: hypothetical protein GX745_08155 [Clostridiales bacterium]|nr:hypothetical protein [Clostridiales bacterium]
MEDLKKHFTNNNTLNNLFFNNSDELKEDVKKAIITIVEEYLLSLKENGVEMLIHDIILVGSNVSYNYTQYSDLDIHIVYKELVQDSSHLLRLLYSAFRNLFNVHYAGVSIKGVPVEIYVQEETTLDDIKSNGIYSIKNGWIKKPTKEAIPEIDAQAFKKQYKYWEEQCKKALKNKKDPLDLISDIYALRKEAMLEEGEYGIGNLIFKKLRNLKYLDQLKQLRRSSKVTKLTLEQLYERYITESDARIVKGYPSDLKQALINQVKTGPYHPGTLGSMVSNIEKRGHVTRDFSQATYKELSRSEAAKLFNNGEKYKLRFIVDVSQAEPNFPEPVLLAWDYDYDYKGDIKLDPSGNPIEILSTVVWITDKNNPEVKKNGTYLLHEWPIEDILKYTVKVYETDEANFPLKRPSKDDVKRILSKSLMDLYRSSKGKSVDDELEQVDIANKNKIIDTGDHRRTSITALRREKSDLESSLKSLRTLNTSSNSKKRREIESRLAEIDQELTNYYRPGGRSETVITLDALRVKRGLIQKEFDEIKAEIMAVAEEMASEGLELDDNFMDFYNPRLDHIQSEAQKIIDLINKYFPKLAQARAKKGKKVDESFENTSMSANVRAISKGDEGGNINIILDKYGVENVLEESRKRKIANKKRRRKINPKYIGDPELSKDFFNNAASGNAASGNPGEVGE